MFGTRRSAMRDRLRKWFGLKCGGVESLCKISVVKQV